MAALAVLDGDVRSGALTAALHSTVDAANRHLRDSVEAEPRLEGMCTSLTAMLFAGTQATLVHIGNTRAYMLRRGELFQITRDDTPVQDLLDEGRIDPVAADTHPQRSLLTRALAGTDVEPAYSLREVLPGDRYMVCSDGLSGVVDAQTMWETMTEHSDPDDCVQRLVDLALRGGGPDNITVIVADAVEDTPEA